MTLERTFRDFDEQFFDKTSTLRLREFLETRGAQAHILTDATHFKEIARNGFCTISCDPKDPTIALKRNILVLLHRHEKAVLRELAAAYTGKNILSVRHDVASSLIAGTWPLVSLPHSEGRNIKKYLILCNPRSGSTYLTRALEQLGVGMPREHIRDAIVYMFSNRSFRFVYFFDQLAKKAEHNGFFGTKLISHFFKSLFPHRNGYFLAAHWLKRFDWKLVYLVRNEKADQALSAYFAKQTDVWHLDHDIPPITNPPYNYRAIRRFYDDFVNWEEDLRYFTRLCQDKYGVPVLEIAYEDLWRDPEASLRAILGFVDAKMACIDELNHAQLPKRVAAYHQSISDYRQRFLADMARRI